jgi:hypothetical protein
MENPGSSRQLKSHDLSPGVGISLRYQGYHLALCETWPHSLGADAARRRLRPQPSPTSTAPLFRGTFSLYTPPEKYERLQSRSSHAMRRGKSLRKTVGGECSFRRQETVTKELEEKQVSPGYLPIVGGSE